MKVLPVFLFCFTVILAGITLVSQQIYADGKKAILVVSFGTSYAETRKVTIEAVEQQVAESFSDYEMRRAFTSHFITKILKERDGIEVDAPEQALKKFKAEGFSEVIVQSTHIIPGQEFHDVVKTVGAFKNDFDKIVIGMPLLTSTDDLMNSAAALKTQIPELQANEAVVFMGHGTHHSANAMYPALERVFEEMEMGTVLIGTVEGFPELDHVIKKLHTSNIENVTLMPLMFVAGDHARNDMASDEEDSWKTILTQAGFRVESYMHGMGENAGIRAIYIQHIKQAIEAESQIQHTN
ncbi:MAG: sirohydrochlorin cobaltochelatase [bacterium]|nr:sirohydrochlorin cobaltochelatase [bacterium]